MPEINPEHIRALLKIINSGPYFQLLSMRLADVGAGYSLIEVDIERKHLHPFGGVHGGVYTSLIDTAAYWAAYCDAPEDAGMISLDIHVDNLAPAREGRITARGRLIKPGRTIYLCEAELLDADGKKLAHGTSKIMITPGHNTLSDLLAYTGAAPLPGKFVG